MRVLVDRMWPRGVSRERACLDLWARDIAPSTGLCKWFGHEPAKWAEFRNRYRAELGGREDEVRTLVDAAGTRPLTLLFAARDERHNNAVALLDLIESLLP